MLSLTCCHLIKVFYTDKGPGVKDIIDTGLFNNQLSVTERLESR